MLRAWVCAWVLCAGLKGWLPHFTFGWMMVLLRCAACSTCSRNGVMKRNVLWILFLANLFRRQPGREMKRHIFACNERLSRFFTRTEDKCDSAEWFFPCFPDRCRAERQPCADGTSHGRKDNHHRCQSIHAVFAHGISLAAKQTKMFSRKGSMLDSNGFDLRRFSARFRALTRIAINNDRKFYRFSCWAEC